MVLRILKFSIAAILIRLIFAFNFYDVVQVEAIPMMISIEPYDDECFLLKVPSSSKPVAKILTGSYEMYDTEVSNEKISAVPLLAYILEVSRTDNNNPNTNHSNNHKIIWRSVPIESRGSFRVPISSIKRGYWLCFQNSNHAPDNPDPEQEHPDHITRTIGILKTQPISTFDR